MKKAKPRSKPAKSSKATRTAAPARKSSPRKERGNVAKPKRPAAPPALRPADERGRREALAIAKAVIAAALDKKALDPVLIDVSGRASYADYIAVVSGRSDRQVDAIAEGVAEAMADKGRKPLGREGARSGRWVLLDFGDVVLHVFYQPLREVFDLESLWIDAPRVKLQIPAEARSEAVAPRDADT